MKDIVQIQIAICLMLFLVVLSCNIKSIAHHFKKIPKNAWIFLFLIIVAGSAIRALPPFTHHMYLDEHYYLASAKSLVIYGQMSGCFFQDASESLDCPTAKPIRSVEFAISIAFLLGGISDYSGVLMSTIAGILSIAVLFLFTYVITKKWTAALFAAFLLCIFPIHIDWGRTIENNVFAVFLVLLFLLFFSLYLEYNKWKTHLLAILCLIFILQTRMEYAILGIFILCAYLMYKKNMHHLRFFIPWFVFVLCLPFIISQIAIGFTERNQLYGIEFFLQQALKEMNNLIQGHYQPAFLFFAIIIGVIIYLIKNFRWGVLFLIMYGSLFIFYTLWQDFANRDRFLLICFIPIILFQAEALDFLSRLPGIVFKKAAHILTPLAYVFVISIIIIFSVPLVSAAVNAKLWDFHKQSYEISQLIEDDVSKDCLIVANDEDMYIINGGSSLPVMSIKSFIAANESILRERKCIYYYEGMICRWIHELKKNLDDCTYMQKNFKLVEFKSYLSGEANYTLYYIKERGP